jgi:hypothetical protein
MTRRWRVSVGLTITVCLILWIAFQDWLPPSSPQKSARRVTGLSIPRKAEVVAYSESDGLFGGYSLSVRLKVDSAVFQKLAEEARNQGYRPLPMKADTAIVPRYSASTASGWYRDKSDFQRQTYVLVILDAKDRTILVKALS